MQVSDSMKNAITMGGMVSLPAAGAFIVTFFGTVYLEKETIHFFKKRKYILPVVLGIAAGSVAGYTIASKLGMA